MHLFLFLCLNYTKDLKSAKIVCFKENVFLQAPFWPDCPYYSDLLSPPSGYFQCCSKTLLLCSWHWWRPSEQTDTHFSPQTHVHTHSQCERTEQVSRAFCQRSLSPMNWIAFWMTLSNEVDVLGVSGCIDFFFVIVVILLFFLSTRNLWDQVQYNSLTEARRSYFHLTCAKMFISCFSMDSTNELWCVRAAPVNISPCCDCHGTGYCDRYWLRRC